MYHNKILSFSFPSILESRALMMLSALSIASQKIWILFRTLLHDKYFNAAPMLFNVTAHHVTAWKWFHLWLWSLGGWWESILRNNYSIAIFDRSGKHLFGVQDRLLLCRRRISHNHWTFQQPVNMFEIIKIKDKVVFGHILKQ